MKNQVAEIRKDKGLTQIELAEKCNISQQSISKIEKGIIDPSLAVALQLSQVLNCKVDDLFKGIS